MLRECPFLESGRRYPGDTLYCCAAAANFYSVGAERELCQICPIATQTSVPQCEYLNLYTFLRPDAHGKLSIQAQVECHRPLGMLPDEKQCTTCPARQYANAKFAIPQSSL